MAFKAPKKVAVNIMNVAEVVAPVAYHILYKDIKKKKDKQTDSGVLIQQGTNIRIFDMFGKKLFSGEGSATDGRKGYMDIEIMCTFEYEQYTSGKIFLAQTDIQPQIKQVKAYPSKFIRNNQTSEIQHSVGAFMMDDFLFQQARDYQLQGITFMMECITGMRGDNIRGCILADSMGLGKTMQSIAVIWMSLQSTKVKRVAVICPVTVMDNWKNEIKAWLGNRIYPIMCRGTAKNIEKQQIYFQNDKLIIVSYETFRQHPFDADLMIYDEGHEIKNYGTKIFKVLSACKCKRRIILTGTPIQNNMKEFFTLCDFVNPGIFKNYKTFKLVFEDPIVQSLKVCNEESKELGLLRSKELSELTSLFILRRDANLIKNYLHDRYEYIILCSISKQQEAMYINILETNEQPMQKLNLMRKCLTHPELIDKSNSPSGKFDCIKVIMLDSIQKQDKVVIVSYYSQTLDIVENHLRRWDIAFLRLDGKVPNKERQALIDSFNDKDSGIQAFLLNGKSGGTGINLIGANKMICIETDWNPANDLQVMARIWRSGQKKTVHIYRLIACGTYEEIILQRSQSKQSISLKVIDDKDQSMKDCPELFLYKGNIESITYNDSDLDMILNNQKKNRYDYPQALIPLTRVVKVNATVKAPLNDFQNEKIFQSEELTKQINVQDLKQQFLDSQQDVENQQEDSQDEQEEVSNNWLYSMNHQSQHEAINVDQNSETEKLLNQFQQLKLSNSQKCFEISKSVNKAVEPHNSKCKPVVDVQKDKENLPNLENQDLSFLSD